MLSSLIKSADWKVEKHVPVINLLGDFTPGFPLDIEVSVGKEIPHPNSADHHIAWIALYYVADGSQLPVELGRASFCSHGSVATAPVARFTVTLNRPGKLLALAYCNLHGLWESKSNMGF